MAANLPPKTEWVCGDFNGMLEEDLLCLSHSDSTLRVDGSLVQLREGLHITAHDDDPDDFGKPDAIFASGVVKRSPDYAQCQDSKWSLRIDADGIHREFDVKRSL